MRLAAKGNAVGFKMFFLRFRHIVREFIVPEYQKEG